MIFTHECNEGEKKSSSEEPEMGRGLSFKLYFVLRCEGLYRISTPFPCGPEVVYSSCYHWPSFLILSIPLVFRLRTKKETYDTKVEV